MATGQKRDVRSQEVIREMRDDIRNELLGCVGRENRVTMRELAARYCGGDTVVNRRLVRRLVNDIIQGDKARDIPGLMVVCDTDPRSGGYYIPATAEEGKRMLTQSLGRALTSQWKYRRQVYLLGQHFAERGVKVSMDELAKLAEIDARKKIKKSATVQMDLELGNATGQLWGPTKGNGKAAPTILPAPRTRRQAEKLLDRIRREFRLPRTGLTEKEKAALRQRLEEALAMLKAEASDGSATT